ncbi:hypothetical protein PNEG_03017 [Pneumocystis murina B123]|uniref:Uncharacterized protein n=1 Tax=Pneumocystis murina (strain B123) TaxID=1069680 RepID=M7NN36_PNEMU|nr:hypothetical protein PNEG_03017 [Pneumocystis murina B123]EMR08536.1 hypothetical protein PNEG_03017 [Pneumocystis murina B123]
MKPLISPLIAYTCTFISISGIIFLFALAALFKHNSEALISDLPQGLSGAHVGNTCILAGLIYIGILVFSGTQIWLIRRQTGISL